MQQKGAGAMLTEQELKQSPLFQNIRYDDYLRMLTCFQAVQKSFLPEDMIYDFTDPRSNSVGILERGTAALIRIDEEGVTAAAYTAISTEGASEPPEEEIDFVVDRPFLFAVTGVGGQLLFAGVVNQPL